MTEIEITRDALARWAARKPVLIRERSNRIYKLLNGATDDATRRSLMQHVHLLQFAIERERTNANQDP